MMGLYWDAREAFYPDRVPGYEEVGDTAFITFYDRPALVEYLHGLK